jgi:hypothetical protein
MQNGKIICCDTSRIAEPVLSPLHKSVSPSKSYLKFNGDARTQRTPKHFVRVGCARQATETGARGTGGRAVRYPLTRLALVRRKAVREAVGFPCRLFINLNCVTTYGRGAGVGRGRGVGVAVGAALAVEVKVAVRVVVAPQR